MAACALLVGLAMVQSPGLLVADTKFDLAVAPADFLARATHLWDPLGAFGQVQNQAYGYLWPMGPFFLLGSLLDVPGWVVQRLWMALVMGVALTGTAKLSRALGVRSDLACLLAGFAFALSPRMLTTLGPISIEAWPSALAPWVLLPLVVGSEKGSARRAAALSALAVAMVGGVNASATFAVLPLGVLWLVTRTSGPRRRTMMLWWPVFTLLGTLWWLVPLALMGTYSPPFLDFIESTGITTFPTDLFNVLRGTSNWVPYIDAQSRAGNDLITTPYLVLNSGVVLLLGFAGLIDRRTPHRQFLALSLLTGVLLVAAGHSGSVHGWFDGTVRGLLDGALSPLRNVHKFDPIVRLPLVLGLAFVVDRGVHPGVGTPHAREHVWARVNRRVFLAMAIAAVAGSVVPAVLGRIPPANATLSVPEYWQQTGDWLARHDRDEADRSAAATALVIPGATFGNYVWGIPRDEPLQWLASTPWATRNVIPLAPPGNIRMLDGVENRLAQGHGSPGLTASLRRAGVRYLVVRNDLSRGSDVPDPVLVHQAVAQSPGLARVAAFGPQVGGDGHYVQDGTRILINGGWQASYPAVEIFEVPDVAAAVTSGPPPLVAAGPEDLADLWDLGVLGDAPALLAVDAPERLPDGLAGSRVVLTDGLRARERFFPRIHDGVSSVITPGDVRRSGNPTRDYLLDRSDRWSTTARLEGAARLAASSSGSDSGELGGSRRGEMPFSAIDRTSATQWVSGLGHDARAWWAVAFGQPRSPTSVRLTGGQDAAVNQTVRVRTDTGVSEPVQLGPGDTRSVELDGSPTRSLRVEDADGVTVQPLALAEVRVPGVAVRRTLVLPTLPMVWGTPDQIVLRADADARTGCVTFNTDVRCVPGRNRQSEESWKVDRAVTLSAPASYRPAITVRPRSGRALVHRILRDQPLNATASSVAVPDVRASVIAAVDGDPGTTWMADTNDLRPTMSLSWLGTRRVSGLRMSVDPNTAARLPTTVSLIWPGGRRTVELRDGKASFAPIHTDQLRIRMERAEPAASLGFDSTPRAVGIGVTEVRIAGVPYAPLGLSLDPVTYPCGSGPQMLVNGLRFQTQVTAAPVALARGLPARATVCSPGQAAQPWVALRAGENDIRLTGAHGFAPDSLVLSRATEIQPPGAGSARMETSGPVDRMLWPTPGATLIDMRENANTGWSATQDNHALEPLTLDGWQQGWLLRSGDGPVQATFTPDSTYRLGIGVGLAALVGLVVVVLLTGRRRRGTDSPALEARRVPRALVLGIVFGGLGLVAGWFGVVVGLLAAVLSWLLLRRTPEVAPWLLAAACAVAAVGHALGPWGDAQGWAGNDRWPDYLALVPLVGLFVSAWVGSEEPRRRRRGLGDGMFFRRRAGRSTIR